MAVPKVEMVAAETAAPAPEPAPEKQDPGKILRFTQLMYTDHKKLVGVKKRPAVSPAPPPDEVAKESRGEEGAAEDEEDVSTEDESDDEAGPLRWLQDDLHMEAMKAKQREVGRCKLDPGLKAHPGFKV